MITIGSLFSGIGGLEQGLISAGCGPVLWQCDSDPCARAVLAAHHPGVRVFDDVKEIDATTAEPVGLVCGGFPCQPHSQAGKRKGTADARWLWPQFQRVVAALAPPLVFIENVPGLRSSGLRDVLADLAALGFDAVWDCFSAAEVGAPHVRRRLFILAHTRGVGGRQPHAESRAVVREPKTRPAPPVRRGQRVPGAGDVADTDGQGQLQQGGAVGAQRGRAGDCGCPTHTWAPEPGVGRVVDGVPRRMDQLRLLGNACVPQQAAHAFRVLTARAAA